MIRYRALSKDGDYTFGAGSQDYLTGTQAVAQAIKTRFMLWKGEWWENLNEGIPMREKILNSRDLSVADDLIKERISTTKDVKSIIYYQSQFDTNTRVIKVTAIVDTIYGELTYEGVIGSGV